MPRKARDVTDAELALMHILWERGNAVVRDFVKELYPTGTPSDMATVQKLLKRLEDKHCISRDRNHWPHVFRPAIQREDLIGRRLQTTADDLCAGDLSPLLTHLVKSQRLSAKERKALRSLLDAQD